MKQKFTVITSERIGRLDNMTFMYRVTAESAQKACDYYKGKAVFIFKGHPSLDGENNNETFLKVVDIP